MKIDALTLDEIKAINNAPIYIKDLIDDTQSRWCIITWHHGYMSLLSSRDCSYLIDDYGDRWTAYRGGIIA